MDHDCGDQRNEDGEKPVTGSTVNCHGQSIEILGMGVVVSLIISFACLVSDGTLTIDQYLVFLLLMLVSGAAIVWRIWNLVPDERTIRGEDADVRLKPGEYRISFKG